MYDGTCIRIGWPFPEQGAYGSNKGVCMSSSEIGFAGQPHSQLMNVAHSTIDTDVNFNDQDIMTNNLYIKV